MILVIFVCTDIFLQGVLQLNIILDQKYRLRIWNIGPATYTPEERLIISDQPRVRYFIINKCSDCTHCSYTIYNLSIHQFPVSILI